MTKFCYIINKIYGGEFMSPLADRIRPQKLEDMVGQEHILGKGEASKKYN